MSTNGTLKGIRGNNARNHRTNFPRVVARQDSAAARKLISDARSPEEQLKKLDAAGLTASKERAKLNARIQAKKPKELVKSDEMVVVRANKNAKGLAGVAPKPQGK